MVDALGENHDQVLDEAKTRIATEMKATVDAVLQHTSSGTCTKDPCVVLSTCKTCQVIKAAKTKTHPGFLNAFDNIDIHLERREMTMSLNNRDIHSVTHEMVQNRVPESNLDFEKPKGHIADRASLPLQFLTLSFYFMFF